MSSWPHGEKIIYLNFSRSGTQIEGGQNAVSIETKVLKEDWAKVRYEQLALIDEKRVRT